MSVSSSHSPDSVAQVLNAWREWSSPHETGENPRLGTLVGEGSAHQVFSITSSEQYVVRVRREPSPLNGEVTLGELAAWKAAADANLAPRVLHQSSDAQAVLTERLDFGRVAREAHVGLLKDIHRLTFAGNRLSLEESAMKYWQLLNEKGLSLQAVSPEWSPLQQDLKLLDEDTACFCHNDLTPTNIGFRDGKALAIDWEYAAMGSQHFDVAMASESLEQSLRTGFAQSVLEADFDESLWKAACRTVPVINHLWELAVGGSRRVSPSRQQLIGLWSQYRV